MNKAFFQNISRGIHKTGLKFKKHSPEIMVVAGVVGTVTSAVLACKATTKAGNVIDEMREDMHNLHLVSVAAGIEEKADRFPEATEEENASIELLTKKDDVKNYTTEDLKKDTALIYVQTGIKFAKLYGPAIVLGALSITSILAGHNITRKRNMALAAAYATIDTTFKEYRGRVVERFGKELDKELRYNIKAKEIEEVVTDENGEEKTVKKVVNVADPNKHSDYARFFDDGCSGWSKDAEYNLMFLKHQQNYANDLLQSQGYLFLNNVYDMLGIPRTKAGQCVGWIYDEKHPVGDNFVDFGIYDIYNEKARDFVNGYERTILLDFNVDGNILDMI